MMPRRRGKVRSERCLEKGSGEPENQLQVMAGQAARMVKQQAFRLGYFNVSDWLVKAPSANPVGLMGQTAKAHRAPSEELHG